MNRPETGIGRRQPRFGRVPGELRIAWRDLRGGLGRFSVFLACLALGVAAIAAVGALSDALDRAFDTQGRSMLGGDVALSRVHTRASAEERAWLDAQAQVGEVASLRTMARVPGDGVPVRQALVELKAVDASYPMVGRLGLDPAGSDAAALQQGPGAFVDPILLARLDLKLGDRLRIGAIDVPILARLTSEPDKLAIQAAYGPRVLVSIDTLLATGLVQPGSIIRWSYRLLLPGGASLGPEALKDVARRAASALPEAGFIASDRRDPAPGARRAVARFAQFLTLAGLTALLVGGIGIANAVGHYLERKRRVIATLRALGATGRQVFVVYLAEIGILTGLGIALGLALGLAAPLLILTLARPELPFAIDYAVKPSTLGLAVGYGVLTALLFVLWPLGWAVRVRPAVLFRNEAGGGSAWPGWKAAATSLLVAAVLFGLVMATAADRRLALSFCLGLLVLFAVFLALGELIRWGLGRLRRPRSPVAAIAFGNITGTGALTRSLVLSLGTGLSLLIAIGLIDRSLSAEIGSSLPRKAPAYYLLDIGKGEVGELVGAVRSVAPEAIIATAPMLRGRLVALKGVPVERLEVPEDARWALDGDRGLTFDETPPEGSRLVAGSWWPPGYQGEPLVSFDAELAGKLGLAVGDDVTVNVLGRNVAARVANLREVRWEQLSINFVMVFSPNTLAAAPFNYLATITFATPVSTEREGALGQTLAARFPGVTSIRVKDILDAVGDLLGRLMAAIRAAAGLTLVAGALVLAGALATAERRRIYQAVVLKTLGATRRSILLAHGAEYMLLALLAALVAVGLGTLAAWLVLERFMESELVLSFPSILQAVGLSLLLVLLFGAAGTARVLKARPMPYLRSE